MAIKLTITPERLNLLTWEQLELFDDLGARANYHKAREVVSLFVDGMSKEEAMAVLGKLTVGEMKTVMDQFSTKMNELNSVNPTTSGG